MKKICLAIIVLLQISHARSVRFQGGDVYSREKLKIDELKELSEFTQSTIFRTGKVVNEAVRSVGTSSFLYATEDEYVFLTNYHVMKSQRECDKSKVVMLNQSYERKTLSCHRVIAVGDYKSGSDHLVFTIKKTESSTFISNLVEIRNFVNDTRIGDELSIVGFGGGRISKRKFDIGLSDDSDCVVLWGTSQIGFNKKEMNSVFFTGCDIRSGDSGSAVFNKRTGSLVGLLFAAANIKDPLTSDEIKRNLGSPYPRFYSHASYVIDIESLNLENLL